MSFFDHIYDQLFSHQKDRELVLFEPLKRAQSYLSAYEKWKDSPARERMIRWIGDAYILKKRNIEGHHQIHLLSSPRSNGFAIPFHEEMQPREFQFTFDLLAEKVSSMPAYKKMNSDVAVRDKNNQIVTLEKYYFKPKQKSVEGELLDQQFGNILIEHMLINNEPSHIKLMVNNHSDSNYQKALVFDHLAEYLLETS